MSELQEQVARFTKALQIDRDNLEDMWVKQPSLYAEVGEWASGLRRDAKQAKQHVEFVYSEIQLKVLRDKDNCGLPKTTEAVVKAYIITHESYTEAMDDYLVADKLASDAGRLLDSFEQRKAALRDLVRLYVHEYYMDGDPKGPSPEERKSSSAAVRNRGERQVTPEEAEEQVMTARAERRRQRREDREEAELEENKNG